jgi:anaerobic selenocysteine-containing dehydrogenase
MQLFNLSDGILKFDWQPVNITIELMQKSPKTTITACTRDCPDACSLLLVRERNGSAKVRGNPDSPFTTGFTCPKVKDFIKRLQSPDRILRPMLRKGNKWLTVSWESALDLCAEKIQALRNQPTAILHIRGEGAKGVLKEATTLFFGKLGSSRVRGSLCDAAGYMAYIHDFGSRENNDFNDLLNASKIINWGKDLSRSSVHTAAIIKRARKKGARVLTISPGGDGNDSFCDKRVRIRPGTDRFLAAAVIRRFIECNLVSAEILRHCKDPQKFLALISSYPMDQLAAACDVDLTDIENVFQFYASLGPAATLVGAGLQRYRYGGENVRFINALAMLSGNIGRRGGGSYFQLHSYRNLNLEWTKAQKKRRRSFPFPEIGKEITAAQNPPIKMIWVNGSNVVNQAPDTKRIMNAFEHVDFKVVVDAFMNDTVQMADLVLPSTLMLEQEDIVGSFLHEYIQYVNPVLEAPAEARGDLWILTEVGKRLHPPIILPDAEACFQQALTGSYEDITLEALRRQNFVRSKRPEIPYTGLKFDHHDGKYRFPHQLHKEPKARPDYPLRLLTLIRREAIHSQMFPQQQRQPPQAWISPDNPSLKTVDLNKATELVSPLGRLKVSLQIMPGLHPEVVLYRRGDWNCRGGGVNQLIEAGLTDIGSGAPFYSQNVRLENV